MFTDIGKKIKVLAKVVFALGTIVSIMVAITYAVYISQIEDDLLWMAIVEVLVGVVLSLAFSWFLYGFGEIIDKVIDIERNTRSGTLKSRTQTKIDDERINNLERLRTHGLITEEEYQIKLQSFRSNNNE